MNKIPRVIAIDDMSRARREMLKIGADAAGVDIMVPKSLMRAVKVEAVTATAANILKQLMLSCGGDAATSYGTIDHSDSETDVILLATLSQYTRLFEKMSKQQFGLPVLADRISVVLRRYDGSPSPVGGLQFGSRTYVMGILNITPDSFSDGGSYFDAGRAVSRAEEMISEGADILDIGGESTRPGADEVSQEEELNRVVPVVRAISDAIVKTKGSSPMISVDTRKSAVAAAALKAGASMVNDISGLGFDPEMKNVLASAGAPVVIMHSKGDPKTMQDRPAYDDVVSELLGYFGSRIDHAVKAGISESNIIIDPGIGFGKTVEHNIEILKHLDEFRCFGRPVCIGTSRKSFIGKLLGLDDPSKRDEATAVTLSLAISRKVDIIRVHNVKIARQAAIISDKISREEA